MKKEKTNTLEIGDFFSYNSNMEPCWEVIKRTGDLITWKHTRLSTTGMDNVENLEQTYYIKRGNPSTSKLRIEQEIIDKIKYLNQRYESRHKQGALPTVS